MTGTKVKDGSLTAADFKAGQLPAGPRGPRGAVGPKGPKGDPGPVGLTETVQRYAPLENLFAGNAATSTAWCKPGEGLRRLRLVIDPERGVGRHRRRR